MKKIDLTGHRFCYLVVLKDVGLDKWGQYLWECRCDCGKITVVAGGVLRTGNTKSCGCMQWKTPNGLYRCPGYGSWAHMKNRCTNPRNKRYKYYGGRGIKVCERWQLFENFHADMGNKPEGLTIERIDNDGDYEPENCRWASLAEQNRNNSRSRIIEHNGRKMCVSEWGRVLNIPKNTLKYRLDHYPPEIAFNM